MPAMKLLVTGNCQARPLLSLMCGTGLFKSLDPIILHLADPDHVRKYEESLQEADLIVAQKTDPTFPVEVLRSEKIKELHGKKTVIWPNIFFSGQQPYLRYFTHRTLGRLLGPLETMHDLRIYLDWSTLRSVRNDFIDLSETEYLKQIVDRSMRALRERERGCDILISDEISGNLQRRLFFTFNHPSMFLLRLVAQRALSQLIPDAPEVPPLSSEPLASFIVPSTWDQQRQLCVYRGHEIEVSHGPQVKLNGWRQYDAAELRDAFFQCYDHLARTIDLSELRVTPSYPGTRLDGPFSV